MKKTRFTETQIVSILNEHESGRSVRDICREHAIAEGTFYQWKNNYDGMVVGCKVKASFYKSIKGYCVLWSKEIRFGMFVFKNSASIFETITKRFNAVDEKRFGYIYGGQTRERNNLEHPIIEKIKNVKENVGLIIPKGCND